MTSLLQLTFKQYFRLVGWSFFFIGILAALYGQLRILSNNISIGSWVLAGVANSIIVCLLVVFNRGSKRSNFSIDNSPNNKNRLNVGKAGLKQFLFYAAPAIMVATGAFILSMATHLYIPHEPTDEAVLTPTINWLQLLGTVIWVPIVEEALFRRYIGDFFRTIGSTIWGSFFSVLIFSALHGTTITGAWNTWTFSLPPGPLLLGFLCEALLIKTGRLWPAIWLHAACNATAMIFLAVDDRWLQYLEFFYQKVN